MVVHWTALVLALSTFLAGAVVGWAMAAMGVVGVVRSLKTSLDHQQSQVDTLADRIQHEVKARASAAGVARRTEKEVIEGARAHLAEADLRPTGFGRRPSTLTLAK